MAEFDDKLNSLLSNPEAMDQIMKMAQSLMGNGGQTPEGTAPSAPGGPAPQSGPPPTGTWNTPQNGGCPPSAKRSRQCWTTAWRRAGRQPGSPSAGGCGTPPPSPSGGQPVVSGQPGVPDLGLSLRVGKHLDPKTIASLLPVLRELGEAQNSNARQLLFALRPYLKPERQDKVERALQLARLFRVGKKFLLRGDGHV